MLTLDVPLLDAIKALPGLGTNSSNTFLTAAQGAVRDMFGLALAQIQDGSGIAAQTDNTRPTLVSFDMHMTVQPTVVSISMVFSETVVVGTFRQGSVTLQSDAQGAGEALTLSAQTLVSQPASEPTKIVLTLSAQEVESIRSLDSLARSSLTTCLTLRNGAVLDASGLGLVAVPGSGAMLVSTYNVDFVQPEVVYFDLDANAESITLKFSESVDLATLQPTYITLQSRASVPAATFTLTGSAQPPQYGADNGSVVVRLLASDVRATRRWPHWLQTQLAGQRRAGHRAEPRQGGPGVEWTAGAGVHCRHNAPCAPVL